jgi:hypothetical protein
MANSIAYFQKYIDMLDEVYKTASYSSVLDGATYLSQQGAGVNEIVIPKLSMDGLADYSRSSGYVSGDVTLTTETVAFNYDRGRKFTVDALDNEESAGLAFGQLSAEFLRTQVVPEMDAFRFATYCGISGISSATAATYTTGVEVLAALNTAYAAMSEDDVPMEDRHLFITPTLYALANSVDTTTDKAILSQFASTNQVPQSRFYTAITLYDGSTTGETAGGYIKNATSGKDINFLIVHKPAVMQYEKRVVYKVITPEANQTNDGWMFFYRQYGLTDAYENKVAGIYLSNKA